MLKYNVWLCATQFSKRHFCSTIKRLREMALMIKYILEIVISYCFLEIWFSLLAYYKVLRNLVAAVVHSQHALSQENSRLFPGPVLPQLSIKMTGIQSPKWIWKGIVKANPYKEGPSQLPYCEGQTDQLHWHWGPRKWWRRCSMGL